MKFFKRKTPKVVESTFSALWKEKVNRQQHRIADYLNEKTQFLSGKSLLFLLVLFCMVFGMYCLYLICSSVF